MLSERFFFHIWNMSGKWKFQLWHSTWTDSCFNVIIRCCSVSTFGSLYSFGLKFWKITIQTFLKNGISWSHIFLNLLEGYYLGFWKAVRGSEIFYCHRLWSSKKNKLRTYLRIFNSVAFYGKFCDEKFSKSEPWDIFNWQVNFKKAHALSGWFPSIFKDGRKLKKAGCVSLALEQMHHTPMYQGRAMPFFRVCLKGACRHPSTRLFNCFFRKRILKQYFPGENNYTSNMEKIA